MRYCSLAVAGSLTLFVALTARAEFPFRTDANRCDSSGNPPGCIPMPNEMSGCNGEMWKFASTSVCTTDPTVLISPNELFGVSGMSVEIAWRPETGRPDVVLAVLDSGIKWNDLGALNDLRKKFYLNRGELPVPQCAPPGALLAPRQAGPSRVAGKAYPACWVPRQDAWLISQRFPARRRPSPGRLCKPTRRPASSHDPSAPVL